ncbi:MAG: DUF502 domain-containing protein [Fusobacteriaceae bacterium]
MKIRQSFYTGLIALLPIILTLYILNWIFSIIVRIISSSFVTGILRFIVSKAVSLDLEVGKKIYTIAINTTSLVIMFVLITLFGFMLKMVFVEKFTKRIGKLFETMPVVKHIYTTVSQIVGMASKGTESNFKKVIALEYPRKGVYSLAFITSEHSEAIENYMGMDQKFYNVFMPTAPNPTTGFFLMVPVDEIRVLDIGIDEAIKLILSAGGIVPSNVIKK